MLNQHFAENSSQFIAEMPHQEFAEFSSQFLAKHFCVSEGFCAIGASWWQAEKGRVGWTAKLAITA